MPGPDVIRIDLIEGNHSWSVMTTDPKVAFTFLLMFHKGKVEAYLTISNLSPMLEGVDIYKWFLKEHGLKKEVHS